MLGVLLATASAPAAAAAPSAVASQYTISATARMVARAQASNAKPEESQFGWLVPSPLPPGRPAEISAIATGPEIAQCGEFKDCRQSEGRSTVGAEFSQGEDFFEIRLGASSTARRGRVFGCDKFIAEKACGVVTVGETHASSSGDADVVVEIRFEEKAIEGRYSISILQVLDGSGAKSWVQLIDDRGVERNLQSDSVLMIDAGPNRVVKLRAYLQAGASSMDGGLSLPSQLEKGAFLVRVAIRPASELYRGAGTTQQRIIGGGKEAGDFPAVGLLVRRGPRGEPLPMCSGVVVGPRTVLTSAHCVDLFAPRTSPDRGIWFVPGQSLREGLSNAIPISSYTTPDDTFPGGYSFRFPERTVDDVALMYLERTAGVEITPLYSGEPELGSATTGTLVTYGIQVAESAGGSESLVKQYASADVISVRERQFAFVTRFSYCGGTTGSPILVQREKRWTLLGIASLAPSGDCRLLVATRMDAFAPWIRGRIK